jgi:hypothetical protein
VNIATLLVIIAFLLLVIFWELRKINSRLRERFPTDKEQDTSGHRKTRWDIGKHTKERPNCLKRKTECRTTRGVLVPSWDSGYGIAEALP